MKCWTMVLWTHILSLLIPHTGGKNKNSVELLTIFNKEIIKLSLKFSSYWIVSFPHCEQYYANIISNSVLTLSPVVPSYVEHYHYCVVMMRFLDFWYIKYSYSIYIYCTTERLWRLWMLWIIERGFVTFPSPSKPSKDINSDKRIYNFKVYILYI